MPKVMPEYKDEVRQKILRAAYHEATENGYLSVRMEDIAARLGISKGTLYLYFKNKHEITHEVLQCIIRQFSEATAHAPDEDLQTSISNIYERTVKIVIIGRRNVMIEFFSLASQNPEIADMVTAMRTELGNAIEAFIRDQQKRGIIDPSRDPVRCTRMIQAVCMGVQNLATTGIEEPEIREIWTEAVLRILGIADAEESTEAENT
ncbi:TetR/AcrR family transcriptional regulator [Methanogenium sp. S4BF]|uniref:TetR/AcrR family transcriptional regulator n=1 Tax=Methanogenium sp. S4BF TaxID=1789226 RepID=UPI002415D04F|nr:TetR/AcrR family transcriptional regulator [Methanogenium sp. S4BF]WFN34234.1 TetR/AcrR family transcriptional regulator [Methanogenium sp. S4BF]